MKKIVLAIFLSIALMGYSEDLENASAIAQTGEISGHEYVDLGLPSGTLWATCNLGANASYDQGAFFSWGETEPREYFAFDNYAFFEKSETDENGNIKYVLTDIGGDISGTQYDAASSMWGSGWRMPSLEDCNELLEYCHLDFTKDHHIYGLRIQGPNDNSIFMPVTICPGVEASQAVLTGSYWTGNLDAEDSDNLNATSFRFGNADPQYGKDSRFFGNAIRPVISKKDISTAVVELKQDKMAMHYANGIIFMDDSSNGSVAVVSYMSGRTILKTSIKDKKCPVTNLSKGIYIVSIYKNGSLSHSQKLIVK